MKVNFYFRSRSATNFSIENVFGRIQSALPTDIATKSFYASRSLDIPFVLNIAKQAADVHHITGAIHYAAFGLPKERTLLTIHDLGHLSQTLKGWRQRVYKSIFWEAPLKRVNYITTISDFTKRQLLDVFPLAGKRIETIYNPVSSVFKPTPHPRNRLPKILQIGGGANKNIDCLIEAVEGLPCHLILVRKYSEQLHLILTKKKISFEFRETLATDQDLANTYAEADIVFFASTYEGFGLPIIEGMACGRPVITSHLAPMSEISQDAALLVNPNSPVEVRKAIVELTNSYSLSSELIEKGLDRASFFSSFAIAKKYLDFYKEIDARG